MGFEDLTARSRRKILLKAKAIDHFLPEIWRLFLNCSHQARFTKFLGLDTFFQ